MNKKIVIAGGTGFIGTYLTSQFIRAGYEVILISRQPNAIGWDEPEAITGALENAAMLINLAGRSVDCRYNEKNKKAILDSRVGTTKTLGKAIARCKYPPQLWINSSTATIYRHAQDRSMTEHSGEIGQGFSVDVASAWENAFFSFSLPDTRQVALRMAIVLGKNGGVIRPLVNLVRFGLGGKQGSGEQMFSWIHIGDLFNILLFIKGREGMKGVVNCSSPNPVDNRTLMRTLREVLNIKSGLPTPAWLLRIGAIFIRTETELVLKSRWVVPERLLQAGYVFKYPTLESALKDILAHEQ